MKKQLLLTAAAVSAIALAGTAQAGPISSATIGGVANTPVAGPPAVAANPYSLASELVVTSASPLVFAKGAGNSSTLNVTDSNDLPAGSYLVTFGLGGTAGASFVTSGVAASDLTVATSGAVGGCTTAVVVSQATAQTISFIVTANADCTGEGDGIDSFTLQHGLSLPALGTVTINGTITSGGNPVDGGTSANFTLIDSKAGFSVAATAEGNNETADLPNFRTINGAAGGVLGSVTAAPVTTDTVYKNSTGTAVSGADIANVTVELSGSTAGLSFNVGGTAPNSATAQPLVFNLGAGAENATPINVDEAAANTTPISTSSYSARVVVDLVSGFNDPTATSGNLDSIVRAGTNVLVPWVASGTLAARTQGETVIRISNIGTAPTGAVTAQLLTSSNNAATGGLFPVAASGIPAKGELVITSGQLETGVFGTDFGRGDLNITVEAAPQNIVIRRFIRNTVNNVLTEVSLGRTATGGGNEPIN